MQASAEQRSATLIWIKLGIWAGLATCLVYPSLVFLHLPYVGIVVLAAALGPLLGVAGLGLGRLLQIPRYSVPAKMAVAFTFAAGVLVTAMLLVQLAATVQAWRSLRWAKSALAGESGAKKAGDTQVV